MDNFDVISTYFVVFTGVFMEGETMLLASAYASKIGKLNIWIVFAIAFLATLISDWFWFFFGRLKGQKVILKRKKLMIIKEKADKILNKTPLILIFMYRYIYGMRTVLLLIIGLSEIKTSRFLLISFSSIITWSIIYSALGFTYGIAFQSIFKKYQNYEFVGIGVIILSGFIIGGSITYFAHRKLR